MLKAFQILVRRFALVASVAVLLVACGQRGPLYLPQSPAAAQRATLPQTLLPIEKVAPLAPPSAPATPVIPATGAALATPAISATPAPSVAP